MAQRGKESGEYPQVDRHNGEQEAEVGAASPSPGWSHDLDSPDPEIRVLFVEDDLRLRTVMMMVAEPFCRPIGVSCAAEAIARLEPEDIDVVIADLRLGAGKSGLWLLQEVATRWPRLRRCLVSGKVPDDRGAAHVFMLKPLSVADLRAAVHGGAPVQRVLKTA